MASSTGSQGKHWPRPEVVRRTVRRTAELRGDSDVRRIDRAIDAAHLKLAASGALDVKNLDSGACRSLEAQWATWASAILDGSEEDPYLDLIDTVYALGQLHRAGVEDAAQDLSLRCIARRRTLDDVTARKALFGAMVDIIRREQRQRDRAQHLAAAEGPSRTAAFADSSEPSVERRVMDLAAFLRSRAADEELLDTIVKLSLGWSLAAIAKESTPNGDAARREADRLRRRIERFVRRTPSFETYLRSVA